MAGMTSCCVANALMMTGFNDIKIYGNSFQEYRVRKDEWPR